MLNCKICPILLSPHLGVSLSHVNSAQLNLYNVSFDLFDRIYGYPATSASRCVRVIRARICKRLWSPEIESEESIQQAYVAWRAGTTNRVVVPAHQAGNRFLGSLKGLQIRAQEHPGWTLYTKWYSTK
jgi:hypothetical protein